LLGGSALMSPAASASAHPASIHTAGKCHTSKNKPICSAIGPATKPTAAWVRVTASGDQRVLVQWSDSCALGTKVKTRKGKFRAATPVKRKLKLAFAHADSCELTATVSFVHVLASGTIKAVLTYRS
jgi:hypothetical protein